MDLVIRTTVVFFFIFFMTRIVGRRELASLEPFDLILLVVIGDLVQQGVTQSDNSVTGAFIVVSTLALLTVGISYLHFRVPPLRRVTEGRPIVLMENGRPIERNLRRERVTIEELAESARLNSVQNLEDVRLAVLETNGNISIISQSS